ncbi:MAG: Cysteinyl-tRNA synthetase [Nitrospira sp.]|jgi:cysteinyl-tRNA synthetase|nr:MAG: Cysteinyl-tRNA synthetase [Nitrospira sp.]
MLKIYNTLTGKKELFEPIEPETVKMYVCGVTVYDYCHIGHARSALVFDVLRRYLEYSNYRVEFVKNFTDVDDKIIKRANEQGVSYGAITKKFIQAYYDDMGKLGVRQASIEPKATEHMTEIIDLTGILLKKGLAYRVDGDVYFDVARYPDYGRLSKRKLEDLQAGARVEVDERKRHPMDFALWKSSKPGEPSWPSPWGPGRPGWHIECSAMSFRYLGETFDIHGGGMDLIFPHHENEIAQSCGATGKEFARYWVHNGFVQVNKEKMSKSLGNFFTIREIFKKSEWSEEITGEILRYFLLSTHYHGPLDFSDRGLEEAKYALDGFYDLFQRLAELEKETSSPNEVFQYKFDHTLGFYEEAFKMGMDDDFNTPMAIASLQNLKSEANQLLGQGLSYHDGTKLREEFRVLGGVLGLFQLQHWQFRSKGLAKTQSGTPTVTDVQLSDAIIEGKVAERNDARKKKDFSRADQIRSELALHGIIIEDKPDGTSRWKR